MAPSISCLAKTFLILFSFSCLGIGIQFNNFMTQSRMRSLVSDKQIELVKHSADTIATQQQSAPIVRKKVERLSKNKLTRKLYRKGHISPSKAVCPNEGKGMKLMILVSTAPGHADQRRAIRLTWAYYSSRVDVGLSFIIGSLKPEDKKIIDKENAVYGDIIQGFFVDSYDNLTLKTISMLEWTMLHCSRTQFLLKVDDDVFVNIPVLLSILDNPMYQSNTIVGRVGYLDPPVRNSDSKYYISNQEYSGEFYPDFTRGPAYVISNDVIKPLFDASLGGQFFKLEDVYVTGIVAEKLNVTRKHCDAFVLNGRCDKEKCATIHNIEPVDMYIFWMKYLQGIMDKNLIVPE